MKVNYIYMVTKRYVHMIINVFCFQQPLTLKAPEDFRQIDKPSLGE